MALIFLRHSRPDAAEGLCYGRTDLPPGAMTAADAQRLAADLPPLDAIVTSPLARCVALAHPIAASRGLPVQTDPDLAEMDFGAWEMTPWGDIPRHEIDAWAADLLHARPHGGETVAELRARIARALARPRSGTTLWVGHAGVARAALDILGHPDAWDQRIDYATPFHLVPNTQGPAPAV